MALTVKKKIWLGTLFLFTLILVTGAVSIFYMVKLKEDAKNVLQDNYESVSYCESMLQQLNSFDKNFKASQKNFEAVLTKQESNVTEPGEQQATSSLKIYFDKFKNSDTSKQNLKQLREQVQQILRLNMLAIKRKSNAAEHSANDALSILITLSGIVFLIAFTFIINFPSVITKPVAQLTDAIKEIAEKIISSVCI